MNCKNCGNEIAENSAFCPECGTKVSIEEKTLEAVADVTNIEEQSIDTEIAATELPDSTSDESVGDYSQAGTSEAAPWYEQPAVAPIPWYEQPTQPAYGTPPPSVAPPPVTQETPALSTAQPVSKLLYILMMIVNSIPLVGLIVHIICMITAKNKNFKNYCAAVVILWIVGIVLSLIAATILYFVFKDFFAEIMEKFSDGSLIISIKPLS